MSLVFDIAAPSAAPDPRRADVACFVGFVARRTAVALPDAARAQLSAAGWVDGVWRRPADQVESLIDLPLTVDSWALFDSLYAWDGRLVRDGDDAVCATYLGAAVRSFFARGGRRATIVRVGDPWPFLESGDDRLAAMPARRHLLLPDAVSPHVPATPFEPYDPGTWQGLQHLHGLTECSLVLLPDLPDLCSYAAPDVVTTLPVVSATEGFVECTDADTVGDPDDTLSLLRAPRLDAQGYADWQATLGVAQAFVARWQREAIVVAALPLPHVDLRDGADDAIAFAQGDMLGFLERTGALPAGGTTSGGVASAFVQLAWPWLRTSTAAQDLPQGLEPADGVLAGLIAANALRRGTFRSAAGDFSLPYLRDVADAEPVPDLGAGDTSPAARLARRVCTIAPTAAGWGLQSDVTTATDEAWRQGGASRLMGTLLRAARGTGETVAFEANGPLLWAQIQRDLEDLLSVFWNAGAFAGATPADAFSVRCDLGTMTQADLDAGRLVASVTVWPAVSIEGITVVLDLGRADGGSSLRAAA
jgi:hypothetical protein